MFYLCVYSKRSNIHAKILYVVYTTRSNRFKKLDHYGPLVLDGALKKLSIYLRGSLSMNEHLMSKYRCPCLVALVDLPMLKEFANS